MVPLFAQRVTIKGRNYSAFSLTYALFHQTLQLCGCDRRALIEQWAREDVNRDSSKADKYRNKG